MKHAPFISLLLLTLISFQACKKGAKSPVALAKVIMDAISEDDYRATIPYLARQADWVEFIRAVNLVDDYQDQILEDINASREKLEDMWAAHWVPLLAFIRSLDEIPGGFKWHRPHILILDELKLKRAKIMFHPNADPGKSFTMIAIENGLWRFLPMVYYP